MPLGLLVLATFRHFAGNPLIATGSRFGIDPALSSKSKQLLKDGNSTLPKNAPAYIKAIMTLEDASFPRLACPALTGSRYEYLRQTDSNKGLKYFFALALHQCAKLLPLLIGSIIETMRFLRPKNCALSIIEGRSDDGTFEILKLLREDVERIGVSYFFNSSEID
jgi:alpha-1,3-mannosyltransferase